MLRLTIDFESNYNGMLIIDKKDLLFYLKSKGYAIKKIKEVKVEKIENVNNLLARIK